MKKIFIISLILIISFVFALTPTEKERDIPTPLNPEFVQRISECGKLDLIDRLSPNYNPKALVDGSLEGCVK